MLRMDRRSELEVVANMLRITGSKTAIMYGANLSYAQTKKYLRLLDDLDLIDSAHKKDGRQQYRPSLKGQKFLDIIEKLEELMGLRKTSPQAEH